MLGENGYTNLGANQRGQSMPASKVTRYDLINKNYIFPQDKYAIESSYNANYSDNSRQRVRTEKVTYAQNEVLPTGKFEANSSYLQDYLNASPNKRQLIKPEGELKVGGKFEGQSRYLESYGNQQGLKGKQQRIIFADNKIMPEGKFQAVSTYSGNYINNPIQYIPALKPSSELKVAGGALQGQSTYLADYYNKEASSRSQKIRFPINEVMPKGQFQGNSTYQQAYINNQHPTKRDMVRHQGQIKIGGQFYGESSYANNYVDRGLIGRQQKFIQPTNKVFPQGKFQEASTYTGNYIKSVAPRVDKIKPEGQLKLAGGTFQGQSNYEAQFINKGVPLRSDRQKIIHPQNQVLPKGNFNGSSNYADNYIEAQISSNRPIRQTGELKVGGKFQGQSNYVENYFQKAVGERREKVTFPQNTVMPQGKFEAVSTYSGNYLNNPVHYTPQIKPQGQLKVNGGPLQGQSTYLAEYYNKQNVGRGEKVTIAQNQVLPKGQFVGNSTYQNTYMGVSGQRNQQIRPQNNLSVGTAKFQANSSYQVDYQGGREGPRYLNKQNEYLNTKK